MSRRVLESKTDTLSGVKKREKSRVISTFLYCLPGGALGKKWQVFQQRGQVVA